MFFYDYIITKDNQLIFNLHSSTWLFTYAQIPFIYLLTFSRGHLYTLDISPIPLFLSYVQTLLPAKAIGHKLL